MQTSAELITPLPEDVQATIRAVKRQLRDTLGDPRAALEVAAEALREEVATVVAEIADLGSAVPVVEYSDVAAGTVPAERVAAIRRRGCAVVRGTFERSQAEAWDDELESYLDGNDFLARYRGPADELFSALSS
ncbi:MAG TPA: YbiU family protein, partial [Desertimonas sp.]|nr:YbiU family protein [Desertimonas sp.]